MLSSAVNQHGLPDGAVAKMCDVFRNFSEIERATLYGSRAKGTYKQGSDIDLTLHGAQLTQRLLGRIADALDDLLLPYTIDLSIYEQLNHPGLTEHIDRVGTTFYERERAAGTH